MATPILDYLGLTVTPDCVISTPDIVTLPGACEPRFSFHMSLNPPIEASPHNRSLRRKPVKSLTKIFDATLAKNHEKAGDLLCQFVDI